MLAKLTPDPRQALADVRNATLSGRRAIHFMSLERPKVGVLEEGGVGPEGGRHYSRQPIPAAPLQEVRAQKASQRSAGQIPDSGSAAGLVEIFGPPAGVPVHLFQLMRQISIRDVVEARSQIAGFGHGLEPLVDPLFDVTPIMGKEPDHPVLPPMAPGNLSPEVKIAAPDPVSRMRRSPDYPGDLLPQLRGDSLVGIDSQYPVVSRAGDRGIALGGNGRTPLNQDNGTLS